MFMKNLSKFLSAAILGGMLLSGCYDDDKLWDAVNEQGQRIEALENWQKVVNSNIEALQALINTNDLITGVTPIILEGNTVGYTITFKNNNPISIYNGVDGEKGEDGIDGNTPIINLTKAEDGNWYWTLNGELMTDSQGNPIQANGNDGKDGEDGEPGEDGNDGNDGEKAPLPQLKTGHQLKSEGIPGSWKDDKTYLSVDAGETWYEVTGPKGDSGNTGPTGPEGDSFFSKAPEIDHEKGIVTFYLKDGSFDLPLYQSLALSLTSPEEWPDYGETVEISYTTLGVDENTVPKVIVPDGWKASVNTANKKILLTAPVQSQIDNGAGTYHGTLMVTLSDKSGNTVLQTLDVKVDFYFFSTPEQSLYEALEGRSDLTRIVVEGELNNNDLGAIKRQTDLIFLDVSGVTGIDAPNGGWFQRLDNLETAILPNNLTEVAKDAFLQCYALKKVVLPVSVTKINQMAFYQCRNLSEVNLSDLTNLNYIGDHAFQDSKLSEVNLSQMNITYIGDYAFRNCEELKSVNLVSSTSLGSIGKYAFYECKTLNSVTLPKNVTGNFNMGMAAFCGCESLEKFNLPLLPENGMMEIGNTAFDSTVFAELPGFAEAPLTKIESQLFQNNTKLEKVIIPATVTEIESKAFNGCFGLSDIDFSQATELIRIGGERYNNGAFQSIGIKNIDLSACSKLEFIGYCTFAYSKAETAKLPENVKTLYDTFMYCFELTDIFWPISVDVNEITITEKVFYSCSKLERIHVPADKLEAMKLRFPDWADKFVSI